MSEEPGPSGTTADAVANRPDASIAEVVADPVAPRPAEGKRKRAFPSALTILIWVIVGDLEKIEAGVRELGLGEVVRYGGEM